MTTKKKSIRVYVTRGCMAILVTMAMLFVGCDNDSNGSEPVVCGDGVCEGNEDNLTCPDDCFCGNEVCEEDETAESCPEDCAACGDGECQESVEDCITCPEDCGECPVCGDDVIEGEEECDGDNLGGETCESQGFFGGELQCTDGCLFDTSACLETSCGDGNCDTYEGETCSSCPEDCPCGEAYCVDFITCIYECTDMECAEDCHLSGCAEAQENSGLILICIQDSCSSECDDPSADGCHTCTVTNCGAYLASCYQSVCPGTCGDGVCDGDEDHTNCPEDCSECGNDICESDETIDSCPNDCAEGCGDGYCDVNETCDSCPHDCGTCPITCGDGNCDPALGESCATCPSDCECGTATCSEVFECLNTCGQDQACVNTCFESGCYDAQLQAQAVYNCMLTNCTIECGADPNSQACTQCIGVNCGTEAQACYMGTCEN